VKEKPAALNRLKALVNEEFDPTEVENVDKRLLSHKNKEFYMYREKNY
jgi:hypothetical protein